MTGASLDLDSPLPPYLQLAASLRSAIASGQLPVGRRLKSVRELAAEYEVASGTVQQALRILRDEGLITSWQGRGTFVRASHPETGGLGDGEFATIMRRLEQIADHLERLDERVGALETARQAPTPPRRTRGQ